MDFFFDKYLIIIPVQRIVRINQHTQFSCVKIHASGTFASIKTYSIHSKVFVDTGQNLARRIK